MENIKKIILIMMLITLLISLKNCKKNNAYENFLICIEKNTNLHNCSQNYNYEYNFGE